MFLQWARRTWLVEIALLNIHLLPHACIYRHFQTKEDVVRYYYARIMDEHFERFRSLGNPDYRLYLTVMFKTYAEHREDFLAIHRQGQSWMLRDAIEEAFGFSEMVTCDPRAAIQGLIPYRRHLQQHDALVRAQHGRDT